MKLEDSEESSKDGSNIVLKKSNSKSSPYLRGASETHRFRKSYSKNTGTNSSSNNTNLYEDINEEEELKYDE
jgi:hypothetical protein